MPMVTVSRVIVFGVLITLSLFMLLRAVALQVYFKSQTLAESAKNVAFIVANEVQQLYILVQTPDIENQTKIWKVLRKPNVLGFKPYNLTFKLDHYITGGESHKVIRVIVTVSSTEQAETIVPVGDNVNMQPNSVTVRSNENIAVECYKEIYLNGSDIYLFRVVEAE